MEACHISLCLPAAYWKIANFYFPYCTEYITEWLRKQESPEWLLSPAGSSQGKRTHTTFPFMRPIHHLPVWLAVTSVLCVKVPLTLTLTCRSPFISLSMWVCAHGIHQRSDLLYKLCLICPRVFYSDSDLHLPQEASQQSHPLRITLPPPPLCLSHT